MAAAVLDFEGFQISAGSFIIKELAVCAVHDDTFCGRWLFKPPHPFELIEPRKKENYLWVTKHLHKIKWDDGELPYEYLRSVLTIIMEMFPYIYVKELEKNKFLEFLTSKEILNLDDYECPKVNDLPPLNVFCPFQHGKNFNHCAVYKAKVFTKFLETI
ncbi:hypothetical protein CDAR_173961 [Caerostris darwini]|uniref:Uncharacterized protein n=1 Tax=Caerostris darwini TaxID=1538125 RepID=A0AAV4TYU7_9ARAC|nr:hypothetical protein CDAR_173961 [Caerostris darwini]